MLLGLKPGHACDPIACLMGVPFSSYQGYHKLRRTTADKHDGTKQSGGYT
jgi:hypothetical protein